MTKKLDLNNIENLIFLILKYNKKCNYKLFRSFIKGGGIKFKYKNITYFVTKNKTNDNDIVVDNATFNSILQKSFGDFLQKFCLKNRKNGVCSYVSNFNISGNLIWFLVFFISGLIFFIPFFLITFLFCWICFGIVFKVLFFISGLIFGCGKSNKVLQKSSILPIYTILVPLYRESFVLRQLVDSILEIKYPSELLDVKFLVEEDDFLTIEILDKMNLPNFVEIVRVQYFEPRTKPKALTYGALFARGDYVVVYDAEDIPGKMQLVDSVGFFKFIDKECFVSQGVLCFYNYSNGFLTSFFNIEYLSWFAVVLNGMNFLGFAIPLGGTTNHFTFSGLKKVGFWDSTLQKI